MALKSKLKKQEPLSPVQERMASESSEERETQTLNPDDASQPSLPNREETVVENPIQTDQIVSSRQLNILLQQMEKQSQKVDKLEKLLQEINESLKIQISFQEIQKFFEEFNQKIKVLENRINQTLRENANFQKQVRQGMQSDLDRYRKQIDGEQYNNILKALAEIYSDHYFLLSNSTNEEQIRKNLPELFDSLEDLFNDYEAELIVTEVGQKRIPRFTKVVDKIATTNPALHHTVARSKRPGIRKGKILLYPEMVDLYEYDYSITILNLDPNEVPSEDQENSPIVFPDEDPKKPIDNTQNLENKGEK